MVSKLNSNPPPPQKKQPSNQPNPNKINSCLSTTNDESHQTIQSNQAKGRPSRDMLFILKADGEKRATAT